MNAAARTLSHGNIFRGEFSLWVREAFSIFQLILWGAVICSALAVVYVKNLERHYVHQVANVQYQKEQLEIQKNQLLLEKGMWSSPRRVRTMAKSHLEMKLARPDAVIMIEK